MKPLVMYDNPTVYNNITKYLESRGIVFDSLSVDDKIKVIQKLERSCKSCSLHYESKYHNIPAVLNKNSKFVFIGRNPNGNESKSNTLYPEGTRNGEIFKKYLSLLGIGEGEVSILNMCQCYGRGNRPVTQEEISKCVSFKHMELSCLPDIRIIFTLGQDSLKWIYGLSHPGSMQCIGDVYESEYNGRTIKVISLPHPSQVVLDKELAKETSKYLKSLRSIVDESRV